MSVRPSEQSRSWSPSSRRERLSSTWTKAPRVASALVSTLRYGARRDLVLADRAGVGERLGHRLVAGQALEPSATPEYVRARVSDVRRQEVRPEAAGDRHRRRHAAQARVGLRSLDEDLSNLLEATLHALKDLVGERLVQAHDPVGCLDHEVHEGVDRGAAGDLAPCRAAHAVGHEQA